MNEEIICGWQWQINWGNTHNQKHKDECKWGVCCGVLRTVYGRLESRLGAG